MRGHFRVSPSLEVLQWADDLVCRFGVKAEEAVGRHCYDLLKCKDRSKCPANLTLPEMWAAWNDPSQATQPCLMVPLPENNAIVYPLENSDIQPTRQDSDLVDLAMVGYLAARLSPRVLHLTVHEASEVLRVVLNADRLDVLQMSNGELHPFVSLPGTPIFESADSNISPTKDLSLTSLDVPLFSGKTVIGSLRVGWSWSKSSLARARRLLGWFSRPLTTAIVASKSWLDSALVETQPIASQSSLEIRCLGRFELRSDGVLMTAFKRTQALTLMKFLVLRRGQATSRDTLCDALWPGTNPVVATKRLHVVVHSLREGLGSSQHRVQSERGHYHFVLDGVEVDMFQFLHLTTEGRKAQLGGNPQQALSHYEQGLELWRGELFADESPAEWFRAEAEHLRETHLSVLNKAASLWMEAGDLCRAINHASQGVESDSLREDFHQILMECYWRQGRRKEAIAQYNACADQVWRELQTEPLASTQRLYERIMDSVYRS